MSGRAAPAEEAAAPTPLETLGLVCARASAVAILVGMVEGVVVSRVAEAPVSGIGLATAGLWLPASLAALLPGWALRQLDDPRARRWIAFAFGLAFVAAFGVARIATSLPPTTRAAPLEMIAAVGLAWAANEIRLEEPLRRPIAIAGIVVAVALQVYATRWVDDHRAFAGLLAEKTLVPRLMLRSVLRRFV